jgi:tetratricopeptide (TPR) repeat protein
VACSWHDLIAKHFRVSISKQTLRLIIFCFWSLLLVFKCESQQPAQDFYDQGWQRFSSNKVDEAIVNFTSAIGISTNQSLTYCCYESRGQAKDWKEDFDGAIADFNQAIGLYPRFWSAYYNRAETKSHQTNLDGAITDCGLALKFNPRCSEAYLLRSRLFARKKFLDTAIGEMDQYIRLNPTNSIGYNWRAWLKLQKNSFDSAIADFTRLFSLTRKAHGNIGLARMLNIEKEIWMVR